MNFASDHYVPVLKVKRGEKKALSLISNLLHHRVTPLLEIVERSESAEKPLDKHLDTAFKDLELSVRPFQRCFIDAHEVSSEANTAVADVFQRAAKVGVRFTPVTGISRPAADVAASLAHPSNGIAIRLTREEFEGGSVTRDVRRFMSRNGLAMEGVDLFLDLGAVENLVADGIAALSDAFLQEIPDQTQWRTLTLSACTFPKSMGGVDRNSYDLVERAEWIAWRDSLFANRRSMPRLPSFSDCAIQHPVGVEGFDPRTMQVSAAVRYTLPDHWLLIKGESTRNIPPSEQFPELATRLVYGHLRSHYAGANHCDGCASIKAAADGAPKLGSAEAWRRFGTIHHITRVVQDLSALPWP